MAKINILVADDEFLNRKVISESIVDINNIKIIEASDGEETLEKLNNNDISILLLDIEMPKIRGLQILEIMRGKPKFSKVFTIVITAYPDEKMNAIQKGANDFITKPLDILELRLKVENAVKIAKYNQMLEVYSLELKNEVNKKTSEIKALLEKSRNAEIEIIRRLGNACEYRDMETGEHILRLQHYIRLMAKLAGFDDKISEMLFNAVPLHDIGKIGIPDEILLKPGRLTPIERQIMERHIEIGLEIMKNVEAYETLNSGYFLIRDHHENYDGTGYPFKRKGEEIHIYGRMCKIVDVFDALFSKRIYKDAYPIEKVLDIMKMDAGKLFDPKLFNIFMQHIDKFMDMDITGHNENYLPKIFGIIDFYRRHKDEDSPRG